MSRATVPVSKGGAAVMSASANVSDAAMAPAAMSPTSMAPAAAERGGGQDQGRDQRRNQRNIAQHQLSP